jgi:hypothetical protein
MRAFGLSAALHDSGAFEWKLFSETLGDEITKAEAASKISTYYERWVRALNRVTASQELCFLQRCWRDWSESSRKKYASTITTIITNKSLRHE